MRINAGTISALDTAVSTAFNKRFLTVPSLYQKIAMIISSKTSANFYPRLKDLPGLREWVGPRVIHQLSIGEKFIIKNRTFEETLGISREDIEDDQFSFLTNFSEQMGQNAAVQPDNLIFKLLNDGHKNIGIDGQYFFDKDHTGFDQEKKEVPFSNILRPDDLILENGDQKPKAGPAWYLFVTTQPLKPFIFQKRRPFAMTARTDLKSGNVFYHKRFEWGVDGRCAAGYGFHQFALRSTAPLNGKSLAQAYKMLECQYRADGTPFATCPDKLFVPASLRAAAQNLINGGFSPELAPDGKTWITGSNVWKDSLELTSTPYLRADAIDD